VLVIVENQLSRSPCGERGLKQRAKECSICNGYRSLPMRGAWIETPHLRFISSRFSKSLPMRGAWIETLNVLFAEKGTQRRSPCGERGLKLHCDKNPIVCLVGRSPCGERGLKPVAESSILNSLGSLPMRGAWIETPESNPRSTCCASRSPCGERGLKHILYILILLLLTVAPHAGSVD